MCLVAGRKPRGEDTFLPMQEAVSYPPPPVSVAICAQARVSSGGTIFFGPPAHPCLKIEEGRLTGFKRPLLRWRMGVAFALKVLKKACLGAGRKPKGGDTLLPYEIGSFVSPPSGFRRRFGLKHCPGGANFSALPPTRASK